MTHAIHTLDLVPLRRTPTGEWVEATCWLDADIERVLLGCICGWRGREVTTVDLGMEPAQCVGEIVDEAAFVQLSNEMEAAHATEIVPAVRDLTTYGVLDTAPIADR